LELLEQFGDVFTLKQVIEVDSIWPFSG